MVIGIGASAGGLDALREMLQQVPPDIPAAFVVVMHLSKTHKSELATIVARFTKLKVEKITRAVVVEPGVIFVLPENSHVRISNGTLILSIRPRKQRINKAIDYFFKSLAVDQKQNAVAVVLTGMGADGSLRLRWSSVCSGMSTTPFESMPCATIMRETVGGSGPETGPGSNADVCLHSNVGGNTASSAGSPLVTAAVTLNGSNTVQTRHVLNYRRITLTRKLRRIPVRLKN